MATAQQTTALRQFLTGIIGESPFGVVTLTPELEVSAINGKAAELLGFDCGPDQLIDNHFIKLFGHCTPIYEKIENMLTQGLPLNFNLDRVEYSSSIINVKFRHMLHGTLVIIEDYTHQHALELQLVKQATHDHLTNLVNRKEFEKRVTNFVGKHSNTLIEGSIIFIDLDRFKPINDEAGHDAGDKLLQEVSAILSEGVRSRDTVSRLGGDEFAILLEDCSTDQAKGLAEKLKENIKNYHFSYNNKIFRIGMSAGICPVCELYDTASKLLNAADNACQIAKKQGRNCIHTVEVTHGEYEEYFKEIKWISTIERSLEDDAFELYLQKIHSFDSQTTDHFEVLIRLHHDGEIITPTTFIPLAERFDLITSIDHWVIENTFRMMDIDSVFSINVSGKTISDSGFVPVIKALQTKYQINPEQVTFELTETAVMSNMSDVVDKIIELRELGYKFALDDFGSGLSSFIYLKNFPIDYLKIDGQIVKDIAHDEIAFAMVEAINKISHTMGHKTVAEHVETEAVHDKLADAGIDLIQGFYLAKPVPFRSVIGKPNPKAAANS
jgi:diguanylate cyclase (GGDEF)-like protein